MTMSGAADFTLESFPEASQAHDQSSLVGGSNPSSLGESQVACISRGSILSDRDFLDQYPINTHQEIQRSKRSLIPNNRETNPIALTIEPSDPSIGSTVARVTNRPVASDDALDAAFSSFLGVFRDGPPRTVALRAVRSVGVQPEQS